MNQKFTGQGRDAETGLDFFQARYFSAALGRFNSPDPSNAGANLFNPQSWNAYTYVFNNPLSLIDPTGLTTCDENGDNCHDTITVPGGPPDPVPTDPCWYSNCGGVGGGGYGDSPLQTAPPSPPTPSVISVPNGSSNNNCVAGFTAAFAGVGAGLGAQVGFDFGATGGAALGAVAGGPGGLIIGGISGGIGGAALIGTLGAYSGARLGASIGSVICSSSSGNAGSGAPTNHGAERMAGRKFSPEDIVNVKTGDRFEQADGAVAWVKKVGRNSYNVYVENAEGQMVTGMKGLSRRELRNLAGNYGWN